MATVGLLLGIVATALSLVGAFVEPLCCAFGLPVAVVGLILSIVGNKKLKEQNKPSTVGLVGIVIGIVATVLTGILFFSCGMPALWVTFNW